MLKIDWTPRESKYRLCFVLESSGYFGDGDEMYHTTDMYGEADEVEKLYRLWLKIENQEWVERDEVPDEFESELDFIPSDGGYCSLPSVEELSLTWYNGNGIAYNVEVTDGV